MPLQSRACLLAVVLGASAVTPSAAHDFWLQPDQFVAPAGTAIWLTPQVGHADDVGVWPATPGRVVNLFSVSANGIQDQQAALQLRQPNGALPIRLTAQGDHLVVLTGNHAASTLEAERFNEYAEEEGITPITEDRARTGRETVPGREVYSRRGKAILRVGTPTGTAAGHITQPVGLTLEITPRANPLDVAPGAPLQVDVHYRGQPVSGATIHVERLDAPTPEGLGPLRTGPDGMAEMARPSEGAWMLHTVWAAPTEAGTALAELGDYDTVFSSLTFGTPASEMD